MGATKQAMLEEMDWEMEVNLGEFMKANGVEFRMHEASMFYYCFIEVVGSKIQGSLRFVRGSTFTRREVVDLLRGLGLPVFNEFAG